MTRRLIVERLVGATGDPDRIVAAAHASATRALPTILDTLNERLSTQIDVEVKAVELARLAESMPPEGSTDAVVIVPSGTSRDALTLQIDADGVALLLDACFGGDPDLPLTPIRRDLTPLELDIAAMAFEIVAGAMNGGGERAFGFRFPLPSPVSGADARKLIVRDGPAVRIVFSLIARCGEGELRLLMPQRVLLESRGDTVVGGAGDAVRQAEWRTRFGEEVMRSGVSLEATMPMMPMTLGDLCGLEVGQLIELPETAQTEARLSARGRTIFVCEFGKLGRNYTVRIKQPFDAGQDFIEGLITR